MGWGEPMTPTPTTVLRDLIAAVGRYLAAPTTGNQELMRKALNKAESVVNTPRRGW